MHAKIEDLKSISRRLAASVPVHAPVPGSGIPTKRSSAIILGLAKAHPEITLSEEELLMQANAWSIRNGGYSGRVAEQFIIHLQSLVK